MIKSQKEIEKMKVAGQLAAKTLEMIDQYVKEGVSTGELDDICQRYAVVQGLKHLWNQMYNDKATKFLEDSR